MIKILGICLLLIMTYTIGFLRGWDQGFVDGVEERRNNVSDNRGTAAPDRD